MNSRLRALAAGAFGARRLHSVPCVTTPFGSAPRREPGRGRPLNVPALRHARLSASLPQTRPSGRSSSTTLKGKDRNADCMKLPSIFTSNLIPHFFHRRAFILLAVCIQIASLTTAF